TLRRRERLPQLRSRSDRGTLAGYLHPRCALEETVPVTQRQTRRSFLAKTVGSAAVVPAVLASLRDSRTDSDATPSTEETYWEKVREQFAFPETKVPMNAANLCPSPRAIADRVTQLTRDIDEDCSFNNRAKFSPLLETSREQVAQQLGVSAD